MRTLLLIAFLAVLPVDAAAQRGARGGDTTRRPPAELDRRIQQRMGAILKEQLRLTDAQARQMQDVNARFGQRRAELGRNERFVREAMRREMRVRDSDGTPELVRLIDRMLELQRERLQLVEEEQRALAAFLTPMQRARYMAFEEELQRRTDEMRRSMDGRDGRGGPGHGGSFQRDTSRGSTGRVPPPRN